MKPSEIVNLPLVTIIITNYNYAVFLEAAVSSALSQTYGVKEVIVVDDASNDDSPAVIQNLRDKYPNQIKFIIREDNGGQVAAFCTGLAEASGEYIVFLDADDVLLPQFVEISIYVHLSLRTAVGFTSSDMFQSINDRVVRSNWGHLSQQFAKGGASRSAAFRPLDVVAPDIWPFPAPYQKSLQDRVALFTDTPESGFIGAPTSGNCYRADALRIALPKGIKIDRRVYADTYVNKAVAFLSGFALIDMPLVVYRIHGRNGFALMPELHGVPGANPDRGGESDRGAWKALVDMIHDHADNFRRRLGVHGLVALMRRLHALDSQIPGIATPGYLLHKIESNRASLESLIGKANFEDALRYAGPEPEPAKLGPAAAWTRRKVAEFCLTFGRIFDIRALSLKGEELWRPIDRR